jgi:D-alanine transfer protein
MRIQHLLSAATAVVLCFVGLAGLALYAGSKKTSTIHLLAPEQFDLKSQGVAFQRESFRASDLLPVYGSSELLLPDPYHPSVLFRDYPSGFTVFPVGRMGTSCLVILQKLAAVGADLRGKKVVFSLTPNTFYRETIESETYAGNFSLLHANALAFSDQLSLAVKQAAAKRMLTYPGTLDKDGLLKRALEDLADGSTAATWSYWTCLPEGRQRLAVLRMQDEWETVAELWEPKAGDPVQRHPTRLDWDALIREAAREWKAKSSSNAFGFENVFWKQKQDGLVKATSGPPEAGTLAMVRALVWWLPKVRKAQEWTDLDILLRVALELGAQPLIISSPVCGNYCDYWGISRSVRNDYYEKLREIAATHHVPLVDFAEHDKDLDFVRDPVSHLSSKGWVYFDQAVDAFYHDKLVVPERPLERDAKPKTGSVAAHAYQGGHGLTNCQQICGWAWDRENPDTPLTVEVYDKEELLGTARADLFRKDLQDAGKGTGRCGFAFPVPDRLRDGKLHLIHVRIKGASKDLGDAKPLTCPPK